jgi:hypothetical protein
MIHTIAAVLRSARVTVVLPLVLAVGATADTGRDAWTSIGPEGGSVTALAIDPLDPQVVYAGTWRNGLFRSEDGGASWTAGGLTNASVSSLLIHPQDPQTLYAEAVVYTKADSWIVPSLYRCPDGGRSWTLGEEGPFYAVALDPTNPQALYRSAFVQSVDVVADGRSLASGAYLYRLRPGSAARQDSWCC